MIHVDGGRALVKCLHCGHPVHAMYSRQHLKECSVYQRKRTLGRMTFEKDGERLYAVPIVRFNPTTREWLPEMHYTHGFSARHARQVFLFGEKDHSKIQIVDVGLAVGMFAADRDGKLLVAD